MKLEAPYSCDICGRQKQTANRWFCIVKRRYALADSNGPLSPMLIYSEATRAANTDKIGMTVIPWETAKEMGILDTHALHVCSEGCLAKAMTAWATEVRGSETVVDTNAKQPQ